MYTVYIASFENFLFIHKYGPVQKDLHLTEKGNDLRQEIYRTT
jgi:hypothetical protein